MFPSGSANQEINPDMQSLTQQSPADSAKLCRMLRVVNVITINMCEGVPSRKYRITNNSGLMPLAMCCSKHVLRA